MPSNQGPVAEDRRQCAGEVPGVPSLWLSWHKQTQGYYKHVDRGEYHTMMRRKPHDDAANATRYSAANAVCSLTFWLTTFSLIFNVG